MPRGSIQNLKPQAHKLTVGEASKGGKKSGETRRNKKTIKMLLEAYLESSCKDSPQLDKLASKMGLKGTESIKQLFTMACVLNSIKEGNLKDLGLLQDMLGENIIQNTQTVEEDDLTKALREKAEEIKNANKR